MCSVCKNEFLIENNFVPDSNLHSNCKVKKNIKRKKRQRPVRTSTPIAELENDQNFNSFDPVTDFFYQSWKRELQSKIRKTSRKSAKQNIQHKPYSELQPVYYAPQFVYVNTVIFQVLVPIFYSQPLHYIPNGIMFPMYWGFYPQV